MLVWVQNPETWPRISVSVHISFQIQQNQWSLEAMSNPAADALARAREIAAKLSGKFVTLALKFNVISGRS